jgi:hypothetical protein
MKNWYALGLVTKCDYQCLFFVSFKKFLVVCHDFDCKHCHANLLVVNRLLAKIFRLALILVRQILEANQSGSLILS